eukprot:2682001-Rhodomonas_salina.2
MAGSRICAWTLCAQAAERIAALLRASKGRLVTGGEVATPCLLHSLIRGSDGDRRRAARFGPRAARDLRARDLLVHGVLPAAHASDVDALLRVAVWSIRDSWTPVRVMPGGCRRSRTWTRPCSSCARLCAACAPIPDLSPLRHRHAPFPFPRAGAGRLASADAPRVHDLTRGCWPQISPEHPLVLYVLSQSKAFQEACLSRIPSGGSFINDMAPPLLRRAHHTTHSSQRPPCWTLWQERLTVRLRAWGFPRFSTSW